MKRTRNGILIPDVPIMAGGNLPNAVKGVSLAGGADYVLQSFNPSKKGYNPAICCKLEQMGLGTYRDENDKTKGWYLTQEQADAIKILNLTDLITIEDTSGINGTIGAQYTFSQFPELYHFSNIHSVMQTSEQSKNPVIFFGCRALSSVIFPENITEVGYFAFTSTLLMANGYTINLPKSVTVIGGNSFRGSAGDRNYNLIINNPVPPQLSNDNPFYTPPKKIFVPIQSVETYRTANEWSNYASLIEAIPND